MTWRGNHHESCGVCHRAVCKCPGTVDRQRERVRRIIEPSGDDGATTTQRKAPAELPLAEVRAGAKRASERFEEWPRWKREVSEPHGAESADREMSMSTAAFDEHDRLQAEAHERAARAGKSYAEKNRADDVAGLARNFRNMANGERWDFGAWGFVQRMDATRFAVRTYPLDLSRGWVEGLSDIEAAERIVPPVGSER